MALLGASFIWFTAWRPFEIAKPESNNQDNEPTYNGKRLKVVNPSVSAKLAIRAINNNTVINDHPVDVPTLVVLQRGKI